MDFFPFYRIILLIIPFRPCGGLSNVNLIHHYIGSTATIKKHNNELVKLSLIKLHRLAYI